MTTGSASSSTPTAADIETNFKPTDLRGILKYIPRFRDQIFVVSLDGAVIADDNLANLLVDIAVLRSLMIKVVLVHGISAQLEELSTIRGVPLSNADGTGVTNEATMDLAVRASSRVSHLILEGLTQSGLKCAITNAVRALPVGVIKGEDRQFTGKVDRIDKDTLKHLFAADIVPIIQPIGFAPDGSTLRINSDLLAIKVAAELEATKVIYLSQREGLHIHGVFRRDIAVEDLDQTLSKTPEAIADDVRSKAEHAVRGVKSGIPRVHLVDGRVYDGLLNEVFSSEGVGTLVYGNDYQQIRAATWSDTRFVHSLIRSAVEREELLHRDLGSIEENIESFFVFEIDENIVACISLQVFADQPDTAEIGSLCVMPFHHKRGIGRKMVEFATLQAKARGASKLVALSTQSSTFFSRSCGFALADESALPESRRSVAQSNGRNAKVLVKSLD
ncbi:MAG: amino-acid N-acetyltransferase [Synoicihabitans sp.]